MSTVVNDSFSFERSYPASAERVFAAWATIEAKSQWFANEEGLELVGEHELDLRPGGREYFAAKAGEVLVEFDARFYDVVENQRIVWAYDMSIGGRRMSVSLGTVEIFPQAGGARLVLTEQAAYLDGLDTNKQRAEGNEQLLEKLGRYLSRSA